MSEVPVIITVLPVSICIAFHIESQTESNIFKRGIAFLFLWHIYTYLLCRKSSPCTIILFRGKTITSAALKSWIPDVASPPRDTIHTYFHPSRAPKLSSRPRRHCENRLRLIGTSVMQFAVANWGFVVAEESDVGAARGERRRGEGGGQVETRWKCSCN